MKRKLVLGLVFASVALSLVGCGERSVEIPLAPRATLSQAEPSPVISAPAASLQAADQTPSPSPSGVVKPTAAPQAGPVATIGTAVAIIGS